MAVLHGPAWVTEKGAKEMLSSLLDQEADATHKAQTKEGSQPFPSALPAQRSGYQTHIVLRSDP